MNRSRGFGSMNTGGDKPKRPEDLVDMIKPGKDFIQLRLIGDVFGYAQHWIDIETKKGVISIPKVVPNYDPSTDTYDSTIEDPYKKIGNPMRTSKRYFVNAIVRDLQDDEPKRKPKPERSERKSGFKDKSSKTWTPVQVLSVPTGVAQQLQKLMKMNKHRVGGKTVECELTDPKYGCDIFISFDGDAKGPVKYNVQKGDASPLAEEEQEYLVWDISELMTPESIEEARKEAAALASKNPEDEEGDEEDDEDEEEDDEEDELSRRRSRRNKSKEDDEDKPRRRRDRGEESRAARRRSSDDEDKPRKKRTRRSI